jgi:hypothetical protein
MGTVSGWLGSPLARYHSTEIHLQGSAPPTRSARLKSVLRPGDVLLVEGHARFSTAIKYLTQSTWPHAALYVGTEALCGTRAERGHCFVEADVTEGIRSVEAKLLAPYYSRICRSIALTQEEIQRVVRYCVERLGHQYNLRNVWDLARYLLPTPPVPQHWRRRLLSLGSGDPARAICSTLIAQAFQSIRYPILPVISSTPSDSRIGPDCIDESLQLRHHSFFAPRDFDVSPYFAVVKPTLEQGCDFHTLQWTDLADTPSFDLAGSGTLDGTLDSTSRVLP